MKKTLTLAVCVAACTVLLFNACTSKSTATDAVLVDSTAAAAKAFGGYETQVKYGGHLVMIAGCGDCHTPKKMGAHGPEDDTTMLLSGHPEHMPMPAFDPKEAAAKGLAITNTETAWIGPWGVSFAANLTPDSTGIGNWTEAQFSKALREGKWMGLDNTRPLLPPMPWQDFKNMSDDEVAAIFAYLKSIKPIHNVPPAAIVAGMK